MLFTQKVAFTLLKKGERGLGMLVDYTSQIIAEAAADFILQQGGWVITDPMAKKIIICCSNPPRPHLTNFILFTVQSNLVNPTLFVSDSFTPDCKVSGLSNQLFMTGNYYGYVSNYSRCQN